MAVSAKWFEDPQRIEWIKSAGFALEYSPDPDNLPGLFKRLESFAGSGLPIRHHGFFPGYEIGDINLEKAEQAMRLHLNALDAVSGLGEPVITFHMGLPPRVGIDPVRTSENLASLVDYGRSLGLRICIENLKNGPSSLPETVLEWAEQSNAGITLDIGHAVTCETVQSGRLSVCDIIDMFEDRLVEVHMYERELDRHYPPKDMSILGPVVDRLLETECRWWTIELADYPDILKTSGLLNEHITARHSNHGKISATY